ncbi:MAG: dihydroneopterin aldolase [Coriobacteriaceae bacterium]|nr:dihydroneopterin aldolase [Coriobacteriaceae bacterium]
MDMKHLPENIADDRGALARRDAQTPALRTQLARVPADQLRLLDKINIDKLEVFANHGVFPEENALGQKFVVSVTFYTDTRRAGETDDLSASIHYGEAAHAIDEFMRAHTFKLIEAAAEGVASMLLERYPSAYGVRVKLEKPWAPVGLPLQSVSVEIERTR